MKKYIFLYGTLQPEGNLDFFEEHKLGDKLRLVGHATVSGDLEHLHNKELGMEYPGLVDSKKGRTHGRSLRSWTPAYSR